MVLSDTTVLHDNFAGFPCWGDLILSEFKNQFCVFSAHTEQKCESGLLLDTKMPAAPWVGDYVIVVAILIKFMLI